MLPRAASDAGRAHFPPPWSVVEQDARFVVRDHNGLQLAYVYFEMSVGDESAGRLITRAAIKIRPTSFAPLGQSVVDV